MMQLLTPSIPTYQRVTRPFGIKGKPIDEEDRELLFAWLDEDVQEQVIEGLGRQATECTWRESCYEMFQNLLNDLGFRDIEIQFSGFWSQGDGACFEGAWSADYADPEKLAEWQGDIRPTIDEFLGILTERLIADIDTPFITIKHRGHYCHEQSVTFDFQRDNSEELDPRYNDRLQALCVDLMVWIYRSLEAEYEYLTSDEQIVELIEANDYRFDADGAII